MIRTQGWDQKVPRLFSAAQGLMGTDGLLESLNERFLTLAALLTRNAPRNEWHFQLLRIPP